MPRYGEQEAFFGEESFRGVVTDAERERAEEKAREERLMEEFEQARHVGQGVLELESVGI